MRNGLGGDKAIIVGLAPAGGERKSLIAFTFDFSSRSNQNHPWCL
jgi:hypothetical protein